MTTTTTDVRLAAEHETRVERVVVVGKVKSKWLTASHWVDVAVSAVLWGAVAMGASGLGLLLDAIVSTVRYGHP